MQPQSPFSSPVCFPFPVQLHSSTSTPLPPLPSQEEVLQEQERLQEEQSSVQARSKHLLAVMQQFQGL